MDTTITLDKTENPELNNQQANEKIKTTIKMKKEKKSRKRKMSETSLIRSRNI